jgi:hypothetical protein
MPGSPLLAVDANFAISGYSSCKNAGHRKWFSRRRPAGPTRRQLDGSDDSPGIVEVPMPGRSRLLAIGVEGPYALDPWLAGLEEADET